jgi:ribosomal protein S11
MVGATQMATINSTGLNNTAIGATTANTGKFSTLAVVGNAGFYNTTPIAKPTAAGAWAGNTAGKALSTALAALGLITDTSTA